MTATHPVAEILPAWLAAADPWIAIPLALFLFGLVGGFAHCAGMCGPFVVAQVGGRLRDRPLESHRGLSRLATGLLPGYHLGRASTYAALGAIAAGFGGVVSEAAGNRWFAAVGLGLAALLFAAMAVGSMRSGTGRLGRHLAAAIDPLLRRAGTARTSYALGLLLGFLPCHMVYAALAASSVLASPLAGALSMTAFAAGTAVALAGLGWAGAAAGRRFRDLARRALPLAGLANAMLLAGLALRAAWAG